MAGPQFVEPLSFFDLRQLRNRFWGLVKRYIMQGSLPGQPSDGQELFNVVFVNAVTFPAGLTDSLGGCEIAPTVGVSCPLLKNGVSIGSMNIASSATTATFTFAADVSMAVGDILKFSAPSPQDATLSGLYYTFYGTRQV